MNRSVFILLGALALGSAIFAGSYFAGQRTCILCRSQPADELAWLRTEFHLNDGDMARIRQLHEGYKPVCAEMCARIAAKKRELESALGQGGDLSAEARTRLNEIAALRAQCQARMMEHFAAVSRTMPPAQGKRYLAEMQRLTLDLHDRMEHSMSADTGHEQQP
jgi:hypothetical protein